MARKDSLIGVVVLAVLGVAIGSEAKKDYPVQPVPFTDVQITDEFWSPRHKNDVILDIESSMHSYFILIAGKTVDIHVINGSTGKYLRTDPDKTENNNLNELPNC